VVESCVQYAERLLVAGKSDRWRVIGIANWLVHHYKDHGFVIDSGEAIEILGEASVVVSSNELSFSEEVYRLTRTVEIGLREAYPYSDELGVWNNAPSVKAIGALDDCVSVIPSRYSEPPREPEDALEPD
jgi:hypothetical protein